MATTRKTITLSDQQDAWVKGRVASGDYTNDSEYFRDLIRRDQEQNAKFQTLKAAIQMGINRLPVIAMRGSPPAPSRALT